MKRNIILLIVWILIGILNLADGFDINYFFCWIMLILELSMNVLDDLIQYLDDLKESI